MGFPTVLQAPVHLKVIRFEPGSMAKSLLFNRTYRHYLRILRKSSQGAAPILTSTIEG